MRFLFVHTNFPAQFLHIATHLAADPKNSVAAIGSQTAQALPGVQLQKYTIDLKHFEPAHAFSRFFDIECRRAEQVLYAATSLLASGFVPDVVVVHSGWGENLPLRSVFPLARIVVYCEFYYRPTGQDVNFDPEFSGLSLDGATALSARNANALLALIDADDGVSPTQWQRSTYPKILHSKIKVIHEGIDTSIVCPDVNASLRLPSGRVLTRADQVITYVSRNLEPLRGYHVFMRALPHLMADCGEAQVVIVGGSGVSYGPSPKERTWKEIFLEEVSSQVDASRIHFIDMLPYKDFLSLLQISSAHVYFTYPFVLSWSLMEAMSAGCPLVVSDTAPLQEVLDEKSAILVPFLDSHALAEAAIQCLRAPAMAEKLGKAARRLVVEEFDLHKVTVPRMKAFLLRE